MISDEIKNSLGSNSTLDHIAIAVNDIHKSSNFFCTLLGLKEIHREHVKDEDLDVVFLEQDNPSSGFYKIELISPRSGNSNVSKFLETKGEGIHHIAYLVAEMDLALLNFEKSGAQILSGYPKLGSRGKTIAFFSPKTTNGVLIEICSIN